MHQFNFNEIEAKYGPAIRIMTFHEEEWSVIESLSLDLRVADVEIQTYDELITNSELMQDKHRLSKSIMFSAKLSRRA